MELEKKTKLLRIDRVLNTKAEILAKKENRSFNNWVNYLIEKEVNSKDTPTSFSLKDVVRNA